MSLRIVGGLFRGRLLKSPQGDQTRPTTSMVREAVFNICQEWIQGARFLDLFAGSGAMGLEAISRGAIFATFIDKDKHASACIRQNIELLQVQEMAQVLTIEVRTALPKLLSPYDIIYIDPPYEKDTAVILDELTKLNLLSSNGILFVEERYQSKTAHIPKGFELINKRRYGIAQLLWYRKSI